jgi:hypothetical protein
MLSALFWVFAGVVSSSGPCLRSSTAVVVLAHQVHFFHLMRALLASQLSLIRHTFCVLQRALSLSRLLQSLCDADVPMKMVTVYQDGSSIFVQRVAAEYGVHLVRLPPPPAASSASAAAPSSLPDDSAILYSRLTDNYRFMLLHAFDFHNASDAIVLEEDLEVSRDFSHFFCGALELLHSQPSLFFCASSYNDNGFKGLVVNNSAVRLGQHFMALGWAITRKAFDGHVRGKWRKGDIWDAPFVTAVMNGAGSCVFPEVARSKHHSDPDMAQQALTTSAVFQRAVLDEVQLAPAPYYSGGSSSSSSSSNHFCWSCVLPASFSAQLLSRIRESVMVWTAAFHYACCEAIVVF